MYICTVTVALAFIILLFFISLVAGALIFLVFLSTSFSFSRLLLAPTLAVLVTDLTDSGLIVLVIGAAGFVRTH